MMLLRFNREPLQFPVSHLIGVRACGNGLIEVEYSRPIDNLVVCEKGYLIQPAR